MKKKIGIISIISIALLLFLNTVFGYQIEVKADFPDIVKQGDYVRYRMYTAASTRSVDEYNKGDKVDGWLPGGYESTPTLGNFVTKGIFFHHAPNCSYPSGNGIKYYYATYSSSYIGDRVNSIGSIGGSNIPASNVISQNYEELLYRPMKHGMGADYGEERISLLNTASSSGNKNYIYVADDYLSISYVEEILEEFDGSTTVWFSYDNSTSLPGGGSMRTSRQFYNVTDPSSWASNVRGYLNYDINQPNGLLSAINYYDNIMQLPEITEGKKVYVRHINLKDADLNNLTEGDLGERFAGNKTAPALDASGKETRTLQAKVQGDYQEVYTLRGNEGILLSNVGGGEYLGYIKATSTAARDKRIVPKLRLSGKSTQVKIMPNNKEDAIYVDFFYRESNYGKRQEELAGTLHFQSILKDGNTSGAFDQMTEGAENQDLAADYIPPDELLKSGVLHAYPYIIQALDMTYYEHASTYR